MHGVQKTLSESLTSPTNPISDSMSEQTRAPLTAEQTAIKAADSILHLLGLLEPLVRPLGYEVVHAEIETHRQRLLRLFIDFAESNSAKPPIVGIEDCVKVARTLDEPLDLDPALSEAMSRIFHGASYELEVSSPGVDRPLRQAKDYQRFEGREVRIHTFRPLTPEELGNPGYQAKNPRQKNFLGTIAGLERTAEGEKILIRINPTGGTTNVKGAGSKKASTKKAPSAAEESKTSQATVKIPLPMISKANLEPLFDFNSGHVGPNETKGECKGS
jgi:ribosome maturation factor RimP